MLVRSARYASSARCNASSSTSLGSTGVPPPRCDAEPVAPEPDWSPLPRWTALKAIGRVLCDEVGVDVRLNGPAEFVDPARHKAVARAKVPKRLPHEVGERLGRE